MLKDSFHRGAGFADLQSVPSVLETVFDQPKRLASALAESIGEDLKRAVAARGKASLVVSGGSTPLPLFASLAPRELPWDRVWITLADERWVDPTDDASNEKLVRSHLLHDAAAAAHFVPIKTDAPSPEDGEAACEAALADVPRPFDVVVLGMGTDGHTASLFPDAQRLEEALDADSDRTCLAVRAASAASPRMTLTLAALLDSHRTVIHITGNDKWQVYRRALAPGPMEELPVRAILNRGPEPIDVYWSAGA
ncbi:MAG: 6-phosphogluconolactonase [Thermoanaerobaculia bacterium]|nr:6-phosphogluconolactonase [Thermoanaerobaculia bacterium]